VPAETPPIEIGYLAQYKKSTITNLGVKVDADLKFDNQIMAVVKSNFFSIKAVGQNKANSP